MEVLEVHAKQEDKDNKEPIQHVMQQNATLIELVQAQQKKIKDLMAQSQKLIEAIAKCHTANSTAGQKDGEKKDKEKK